MVQMDSAEKIACVDPAHLEVVKYPDPRLLEVATGIDTVDDSVRTLARAMLKFMFESHGVGLAAPQVGVTVRMFVASPNFDPEDCVVMINPQIISAEGSQDAEEGCLSLPGVACKVKRSKTITITGMGLDGQPFEEHAEDMAARVYQHEFDHLEGRLLVHRMGTVAKLANRRVLKDLEAQFAGA